MDTEILSRLQFALTAGFHFIFPPITIGFSLFILFVEAAWVRTGNKKYREAAEFFLHLFSVLFSIGVATGIIMIFQFGTNWPRFSEYVGDVFGSPLVIEAVFAFFLESIFLGISLFGWEKLSKRMHCFSTAMVCLGSHLSAVWILVANSFMQTPSGYKIEIVNGAEKAVITDFLSMVFNPSSLDRITHTIAASWLSGAFLAMGICAWFILKNRPEKSFAVPCMKMAVYFALAASTAMLLTGHSSAVGVASNQPEKLAAFEGHYDSQNKAGLYLFGWVDEAERKVRGVKVDSLLSILAFGSSDAVVEGLNDLPSVDFLKKRHPQFRENQIEKLRGKYRPPVGFCFQTFRFMAYFGILIFAVSLFGSALAFSGKIAAIDSAATRLFLKISIPSVLLPLAASQCGWAAAEVGRQPWTVWHLLETSDAMTTSVAAGEILFSLICFVALFCIIGIFGIRSFLLKIANGTKGITY